MSRATLNGKHAAPAMALSRCAIYTRKSSEEGLKQEFNSLDAQREAAEAYIASQKNEGWTALPDRYDDGGFSGGNVEVGRILRRFLRWRVVRWRLLGRRWLLRWRWIEWRWRIIGWRWVQRRWREQRQLPPLRHPRAARGRPPHADREPQARRPNRIHPGPRSRGRCALPRPVQLALAPRPSRRDARRCARGQHPPRRAPRIHGHQPPLEGNARAPVHDPPRRRVGLRVGRVHPAR
jgi:hypothetical protein